MPRRLGKYATAAALLLLLAAGTYSDGFCRALKVGTEIFAVDPARVLEVSYRTPDLRLLAHRWNVRDQFLIIFMDKQHSRPAVCPGGDGFAMVLKQLTSLKLRRTLDAAGAGVYFQKKPLHGWAELVIRDNSQLEPFQARLTPVEGTPDEALVHVHGVTYVVNLDHQVFRLISGGCRSLAETRPEKN